MRETTFIYVLNDPRDGRIRYVGKSDDPYKRWIAHMTTADTNDHRGHWVSSLLAAGLKPELEILEEIPMKGWQEIEKEYIRVFRMVNMNLTNSTDGGEGTSGNFPSQETRAKLSAAHKGRVFSPEIRAKLRASNLGQKRTAETCANNRAARLGKKPSDETRIKLSAARTGSKNPFFGKKHSPDSITKMRASHIARYQRLRANP